MNWFFICLLVVILFLGSVLLYVEDFVCVCVRLVDLGWSDIVVINVIVVFFLESFGYQVKIDILLVLIIYGGLCDGQVDVFFGGWMFVYQDYYDKFVVSGQVECFGCNFDGICFILVVLCYVWDVGVYCFEDFVV